MTVVAAGWLPVEAVFERGRWDDADLAVQASVVEPVHLLGGGELEVGHPIHGPLLRTSSSLNGQLNASARARRLRGSCQPTSRREKTPTTKAAHTQPETVRQ